MDSGTLLNILMVLGAGGLGGIITAFLSPLVQAKIRKWELIKEENVAVVNSDQAKETAKLQAEQIKETAKIQAAQMVEAAKILAQQTIETARLQSEAQVGDSDLKIYEKIATRLDSYEQKLDALHSKENDCQKKNMELTHSLDVLKEESEECKADRHELTQRILKLESKTKQNETKLLDVEESVEVIKKNGHG